MIADFTKIIIVIIVTINIFIDIVIMMALITIKTNANHYPGKEKPCGKQARKTEHL